MQTPDRPRITVGILIYNRKKALFLTRSHQWKNTWVVPGGGLHLKETFLQCAQREVKEETNMTISKLEFLGIQEAISPKEYSKHPHLVLLDFCAKYRSGTVKLNDEAEEFAWVSPQKALRLKLGKYTRVLIKNFIKLKKL